MSKHIRAKFSKRLARHAARRLFAARGDSNVQRRILLICYKRSATQEVHFLRPLRDAEARGQCQILLIEESDLAGLQPEERLSAIRNLWGNYRPTLLIFSRYAGDDYHALIAAARTAGTPTVAHLDDDLFDVPEILGHEKKAFHGSERRLHSLKEIFRAADLIYVPTYPLAEAIRSRHFGAKIVVPSIQASAQPDELARPQARSLTLGYMGSFSHQHDLDMVVPSLGRLLEAFPRMRFETFGTIRMPAPLTRFGKRVSEFSAEAGYAAFLRRLKRLKWQIGIAPLRPMKFNQLRTYTKWIEYTIAGICVVASDSVVYRDVIEDDAGVLIRGEEWFPALARMAADPRACRAMVAKAQEKAAASFPPRVLAAEILALEETARTENSVRQNEEHSFIGSGLDGRSRE